MAGFVRFDQVVNGAIVKLGDTVVGGHVGLNLRGTSRLECAAWGRGVLCVKRREFLATVSAKNDNGEGCDGCNSKFQNFNTLLNTFGKLSYLCKEGGEKAACLTASFASVRVDAAPPVCTGF